MRVSPQTGTAGRVRRLAADLATTIAATTGTALALAGRPESLAVLAVAFLGLSLRAVFMRRSNPARHLLTTQTTQRALLGAGCGVALVALSSTTTEMVGAALGTLLVTGSVMYEPYQHAGAQLRVPFVAHLPGLEDTRPRRDLTRHVLVANVGAVGLGLAIGALGASTWWWALAAAAQVLPLAWLSRDNRLTAARIARFERDLPGVVAAYAPEYVLYTSWPFDASHQVTMWLPFLQRSGRRGLVIMRNDLPAAALARATDLPVVAARGPADLDALVPPSLRAAFYPNASSGNGLFVRYQQLRHVFLGHGDSDKPTSSNPTHAMYDKIFVAGPAAVRRYPQHGVAIDPGKFEIVGRPQVERITPVGTAIATVPQPSVLYAPTWRGHVEETDLSSLPVGERIVDALLDRGLTVIFRPHPFSYGYGEDVTIIERIQARLAADQARTGRAHIFGDAAQKGWGLVDCINASDAMISDVSGVVSDYLFSLKPFAMVAVPSDPEQFANSYSIARAGYVLRGDLAGLEATLARMLTDDPMRRVRERSRDDYLGPFPADRYASHFVDAVRAVLEAPRQQRESEEGLGDQDRDVDEGAEDEAGDAAEPAEVDEVPAKSGIVTESRTRGPSGARGAWARYVRLLTKQRRFNQVGSVLAISALVSVLLGAPPALALVLSLASVAAVGRSVRRVVSRRTRWSRLLAASMSTRAVLIVAAAATSASTGRWGWASGGALVLLSLALVGERPVRSAWGSFGLKVVNLPEAGTEVRSRLRRGVLPLASAAAIALSQTVATLGGPPAIALGAAVTVFGYFVCVLVPALRRAARVKAADVGLYTTVTRRAPEFAVYFGSSLGADYQLGMWLPYFTRIGRPFVIVVRSAPMLREVARVAARQEVAPPIVLRPSLRSLEEVIVPSLKVAFYVNNAPRNTHFIERRELTHVWLNHGDSEKPACYNPVHAIYDLIFVAGQAGIDRYARHGVHIPAEKFRIVGRPQVEQITRAATPITDLTAPTVLYAPTWQGPYADSRLYSLPQGREIVDRLLSAGCRVIFRAHPLNYQFPASARLIRAIGRRLAKDREESGREHLWGAAAEREMSVEQCFNSSDAMIADVSAVLTDYLHSEKPYAIVSVGRTPERLLLDAPVAAAAYVIAEDLTNLDQVIKDLLIDDPLAASRRSTRIYYLGDFDVASYADGFLQASRDLLGIPAGTGRR